MIVSSDKRFQNLERKVGIFVLIALLGIIGAFLMIGIKSDLFTRTYQLHFTTPKGTGFTKGMPVKLTGFRIGRVKDVSLNAIASVDVTLQIDRRYQKWIHRDAVARLVKEGLIGDMIIDISGGSANEVLPDKGTITFVKTKGLDELADDIAEKVKPVLIEVRDIISYVNDPNGDLKQSIGNIRSLTANLEQTRRHVDQFMDTTRQDIHATTIKATATLDATNARLQEVKPVIEKVDRSVATVEQKLPGMITKLENSLSNLEAVSIEVKKSSSKALPKLPSLMERADEALDDGDSVLKAMKGMWPIRSYVPQPEERRFINGDSHE